jgi:hypothetical protein
MTNTNDKPEQCMACRFYKADHRGAYTGECLRFPPTVVEYERHGVFPIVRAGDWCGEFKRKVTDDVPADTTGA